MNYMNKRLAEAKAVALVFCMLALASARAAVSENSWKNAVADGEWAEAANWNTSTFYPMAVGTAAAFSAPSGSSGTNIVVRLPDESGKLDHLHVLMHANAAYTFDGTGRTFALGARDSDEPVRGTQDETGASFYPFAIMGELASNHQAINIARNGSSGYRDAVLTWENARLKVSSPSWKHVVTEFIGGTFDFDPGHSRNWTLNLGFGTLAKSETAVSNATVRSSTFSAAFYSTNNVLTVGAGGVVECYGPISVGYNSGATYDWDATNELVVADGGHFAFCNGGEKTTAEGFFMGSQNAMKRRNLAKFTGTGTLVDFRQAGNSYFTGNTAIDVSDGATLVLAGRAGLGYNSASAVDTRACELRISGNDTRVLLATNLTSTSAGNGFFYVGAANHSSNRVVMTGGKIAPLYPAAPSGAGGVNIRVASANSNTRGLFEMRGGDIDLWVTNNSNPAVNCCLSIGPGNGEFHMSGGTLYCGDLNVGVNGGTKTTVQRLRMTGGKINCNRLYLGSSSSNSTFQYQDAHVDLDGGVLTCRQYAFVSSSALFDAGGYAHGYLTANGGTLRATQNQTLLQKFDTAEMGPKGLTIDNNGKSATITQSFSNKPGEEGCLIFTGSGTATLKPDRYYSVSRTIVRGGTLTFATNTVLATTLVITNGATVSLDGTPTKITVDSLIVPKGTLYLNPGDAIHLTSDQIDLSGLTVRFTGTPASGSTYDFLEFDGDMTENETVRDAMRWLAAYTCVSGNHAAFTLSYDEGTGKTTATATYKPDVAPLADETVWNGPAWDSEGWSAGVPTAEKVASFSNASAPTAVPVPANAEVGAISVSSGEDYVFTGTGLEIPGEKEGSWLGVSSGSATFNLPIGLLYSLPVALASGTSAVFNRPVTGGVLVKTGKGALTLAADNHFRYAVSVGGGLNVVAAPGALAGVENKATLTEDTLVFTNAIDDSEMVVATPVVLASATSKTNAVVIKADSDVRLADLTVTKGALVKRGRGKLTIDASAEKNVTLSCDYGVASGSNHQIDTTSTFSFADDGTAPAPETKQYAGFNIAEGEVVIKGEPDVSKTVNALTGCCIGMNLAGDSSTFEQPVLTVDGVYLDTYASGHTTIGIKKCGASGCAVARPMLRVLNGGRFRAGNIRLGYGASNAGAYPTLVATNAKVHAVNAIRFEVGGSTADRGCIVRAKDSTIAVTATGGSHHGTYISGAVDADFDNCIVGGTAEIGKLQYQNASAGTLRFRNGSVLAAYPINTVASAAYNVTLLFDDAEWSLGDGDVTIASTSSTGSYYLYKNNRVVKVENTGMILKPTSGHTYTFSFPITGTGGLVSAGEGTVKLTGNALQFAGLVDIRSGTVDLTAANARDSLAVRGPGTLKGGTITTLTISESLDDGTVVGTPVLDGVTAEHVVVNFGRDETSPIAESEAENLLVATYSVENPPTVGRWRVAGTGLAHPRAEFTVSGGEVRATVKEAIGTMMIIR